MLTAYTCQAVVCQVQQLHVLQRHKLIQDAHIACQSPTRQADAQDSTVGRTHNTSPRLTCGIDFPRIVREAKVIIIGVELSGGAQNVAVLAPTLPLAAAVHLLKGAETLTTVRITGSSRKYSSAKDIYSVLGRLCWRWQHASGRAGYIRRSCLSALRTAAVPALPS